MKTISITESTMEVIPTPAPIKLHWTKGENLAILLTACLAECSTVQSVPSFSHEALARHGLLVGTSHPAINCNTVFNSRYCFSGNGNSSSSNNNDNNGNVIS